MPVRKSIPDQLSTLIAVQPLLEPLPQKAREALISEAALMNFEQGETLIREDETNDHLFILLKGEAVAIMNGTEAGRLEAGDVAGEISAIGISPPIASVIADSEIEAVAFPATAIVGMAQTHPEFGRRLKSAAIRRITDR